MNKWFDNIKYNPIPPLLECDNEAILTFVRRDLLDKTVSGEDLWKLAEPQKILRKQKLKGSWIYPGGTNRIRTQENYNQIEKYRNLGTLVEEFCLGHF